MPSPIRPSRARSARSPRQVSLSLPLKPAAEPLRFPRNLIKLLDNNLEIIPEQAYHQPLIIAPGQSARICSAASMKFRA